MKMSIEKNTVERRDQIAKIINEIGNVRVSNMSDQFDVSDVTIRNDLDYLEKIGMIHRIYGGAILNSHLIRDASLREKERLNSNEKKRIGVAAAKMINDGESIILDSGTTTLEIARNLDNKKELTVLTNAVNIASELVGMKGITTIMTGGTLRKKSFSIVGPQAAATLMEFNFDKLFLGVDGFDLEFGLTTPNQEEARLNRLMVEASSQIIMVCDSSKFGRRSLSLITKLESIHIVITDSNIPPEYSRVFSEQEIELLIA